MLQRKTEQSPQAEKLSSESLPAFNRQQLQRLNSLAEKFSLSPELSRTDVHKGPNGLLVNIDEMILSKSGFSRVRTFIVPVEGGIEKGFFRFRAEGGKLIEAVKCGPYGESVKALKSASEVIGLLSRALSFCVEKNRVTAPMNIPYNGGKSLYGPSFDQHQTEGEHTKRPPAPGRTPRY